MLPLDADSAKIPERPLRPSRRLWHIQILCDRQFEIPSAPQLRVSSERGVGLSVLHYNGSPGLSGLRRRLLLLEWAKFATIGAPVYSRALSNEL